MPLHWEVTHRFIWYISLYSSYLTVLEAIPHTVLGTWIKLELLLIIVLQLKNMCGERETFKSPNPSGPASIFQINNKLIEVVMVLWPIFFFFWILCAFASPPSSQSIQIWRVAFVKRWSWEDFEVVVRHWLNSMNELAVTLFFTTITFDWMKITPRHFAGPYKPL